MPTKPSFPIDVKVRDCWAGTGSGTHFEQGYQACNLCLVCYRKVVSD